MSTSLQLNPTLAGRAQFALEATYSASAGRIDRQLLHTPDEGWPYDQTWGEVDENDQIVTGGYKKLVDFLANGLDIRLKQTVGRIEHNKNRVTLSTTSGQTYEGTHVIVTVPLGVLKANGIKFDPALPSDKNDAIKRVGFGTFEKVIFNYSENFWGNAIGVTGYYAGVGIERAYPIFIDMSKFAGSPTLVCIYSGHFAQVAQDTLSDSAIVAGAQSAIADIVGKKPPTPVATRVTRWRSDPYSLGSYSFVSVDSRQGDSHLLAKPVGERLLFAGEATSGALGASVDGALGSGLREAQRLVSDATLPGVSFKETAMADQQ